MAMNVISPGLGVLSDDESPVFESTAADCASGIRKDLLNDFSVISPGLGHPSQVSTILEGTDKVMVYVRIRPFVDGELDKKEDQGCVVVENQETLMLRAPKDSFAMKNTERGMGQSAHKFSFSQIYGPEIDQKQFFDGTMRLVVKDALNGQNWLVYTYGVTNSGKTYTIQGTNKDGGILPRSIALIFNSAQDRLYKSSDLKPLSNEVIWLDSKQVRQEELKKISLICNFREEEIMTPMKRSGGNESQFRGGTSISFDSGIGGLSSTSHTNQTSIQLEEMCSRWGEQDIISLQEPSDIQLSIWVSYFEIYNEFVYDLLEPMPSGPNRKRTTLRLCEDRNGSPYVKDLNWINVHSADEAWKVLKVGRKNQSFASTHLNQNSSRSHSIFSIRILHLQGKYDMTPKISELTFCDLAGSERCKDQSSGDRLKEATNINTSLHTLGRCISALRQNQQNKLRQNVVPFRDSKLTRVFQAYFTGRGKSCMIVNINQCASTYDETLHAMKFSAIASQLVQAPPVKINLRTIQSLIKESSVLANRSYTDDEDAAEASDEESDTETDITMFNREELLQVIEHLRQLMIKERQEKMAIEMKIRNEVCSEMMEMMQQQKSQFSETMEDERELLEELYEGRLENLKDSLTNYYKRELEERDERIEELQAALEEAKDVPDALNTTKNKKDSVPLRRSKRLATSDMSELNKLNLEIADLNAQLKSKNEEIERLKMNHEPPSSARTFTAEVDRKILEGQKNIRSLRTEIQKFGESLQQMNRACCHTTGAERLRQALGTCDDILCKQEKTLAELQNNMSLVKMDLRKKTACIAEQYHTVQRLQGTPSGFKRMCNNENMQPNQSSEKKPFLRNLLGRTPGQRNLMENSPYSRVLRARRSPVLKTIAFGTKY
ncbi:PREDICTED: kinesin-like protein KIF20A isoform X3 [Nanorana parkeri]|uniref:kinesin-like protein KIF20A isoform X3 n=1 Tax=Nanorana parkeri TaxID=125878 RepID=UPI000854E2D9|nr:PREDICTED: kinesin-like protein KIF20A isoform X3 [Nanorana parkeri]